MLKKPKIGEKVVLTIDITEDIRGSCVPRNPITQIKGVVIESNSWDNKNTVKLFAIGHSINEPVIELRHVLRVEPYDSNIIIPQEHMIETVEESEIFSIKSSSSDEIYRVSYSKGSWSCNCVAGIHGKMCKHVKQAQALMAAKE